MYHVEQTMFGFHTPYDYHKPHHNLLVPYIHLIATLHMLKMTKKPLFIGIFWLFEGFLMVQLMPIWVERVYFLVYT